MKKGKSVRIAALFAIAAVLLMVAAIPHAAAKDENQGMKDGQVTVFQIANASLNGSLAIDTKTQMEIDSMHTSHGAKIRLLQLEKSIARNIAIGNHVIKQIEQMNQSVNTSDLLAILAQMQALKEQVHSVSPGKADRESAKQFVEFKHDAVELAKEFREEVRSIVPPSERDEIAKGANLTNSTEISSINAQIKANIQAHNALKVEKILVAMGKSDAEFVADIEEGDVSAPQVKAKLKAKFAAMTPEEKKEAALRLKEDRQQKAVFGRAVSAQAKAEHFIRKDLRIMERLSRINDSMLRGAVQRHLEKLDDKSEKLNSKIDERLSRAKDGMGARIMGNLGMGGEVQ